MLKNLSTKGIKLFWAIQVSFRIIYILNQYGIHFVVESLETTDKSERECI